MIDAGGWLQSAKKIPSPNFNLRPGGMQISLLVFHNISLPPGEFGGHFICDFFRNCLDPKLHPYFDEIADLKVSAHFLIDRDGSVIQFVSTEDRAWHAGESCFCGVDNCNDFSIGIELEGTDDVPYTDSQYRVLAELTKTLMARYPAIAEDRIVGHSDVAPGRKTDPGPSFDWDRFKTELRR